MVNRLPIGQTALFLVPNLSPVGWLTQVFLVPNIFGSTSNCIQCFKIYAGAQFKPVFGGFETQLKFIKFGLWYKITCRTDSRSIPNSQMNIFLPTLKPSTLKLLLRIYNRN